jgi:hypothetical protein
VYILRFENDRWVIEVDNGGAFWGSLPQVTGYCTTYLGFMQKELDMALDEMIKSKHDEAHFGTMKCFIFSKTQDGSTKKENLVHGLH